MNKGFKTKKDIYYLLTGQLVELAHITYNLRENNQEMRSVLEYLQSIEGPIDTRLDVKVTTITCALTTIIKAHNELIPLLRAELGVDNFTVENILTYIQERIDKNFTEES